MNFNFLPIKLQQTISKIDINKLYEIRIRENRDLILFYENRYITCYQLLKEEVICSKNYINEIIENITEKSMYSYNDQIKNGYITIHDGIRIGICGRIVFFNGQVKTITDFSSLNIRIPHFIKDSSKDIFNKLLIDNVDKNILICSKPFMGKTTILKDLITKINRKFDRQILVIDERNEFIDITGDNIDIISNSSKLFAFNYAVRSMSPQIIICDEISSKNDWLYLENAKKTGVYLIASCHIDCLENLKRLSHFNKNIFNYYVFLKSSEKKGIIDKIFNESLSEI